MLRLILGVSFVAKILVVLFFHEKNLSNEWSILFDNFERLKIYSYYTLEGQNIPSSYMPPLYLMFLYGSKLLSFELFNFIYVVYFLQVLLSTISVLLFFKFCNYFFDKSFSTFGALIFAFFPLVVLSTALISSATIQLLFYLLFLNLLMEIINDRRKINILLFSIVNVCCLLLRGEFLIILFLSFFYIVLIDKKKISFVIITFFTTFVIISPYLIRNYINSDKIHIVNVTGYALWKGNNHLSKVEGFHAPLHPMNRQNWPDFEEFTNLYQKLDDLEINKKYETKRDKIFLNEALENILQDKKKYSMLYVKKIFSYFFADLNSSLLNYYNFFHVTPVVIIGTLAVPGIFLSFIKKDKKLLYVLMIMFSLIFLISIFFILPRYKISIIIFLILFSLFSLNYLFKKFFRKN